MAVYAPWPDGIDCVVVIEDRSDSQTADVVANGRCFSISIDATNDGSSGDVRWETYVSDRDLEAHLPSASYKTKQAAWKNALKAAAAYAAQEG